MQSLVEPAATAHSPESLTASLLARGEPGVVLLRSGCFELPEARYSLVAARPFLTLRARGSECELRTANGRSERLYGNPWRLLESLLARYELLDAVDLPFPLGGAFGFWGYGLRRFVEPRLGAGPPDDLELPDCIVGFHDSLVVFDHRTGRQTVVATGLRPDGSRDPRHARQTGDDWHRRLQTGVGGSGSAARTAERTRAGNRRPPRDPSRPTAELGLGGPLAGGANGAWPGSSLGPGTVGSTFTRDGFCRAVQRARDYIRSGDIYQVNLAQRLHAPVATDAWGLFEHLVARSPSPFAAFLEAGDFQLASLSPELFLRLSGAQVVTRPIKGTRPRSPDPIRDAQLAFELQTSAKELAELVMITDLLRNDLGRVSEYGSVQVPELLRLEKYAHVQHLVSTVAGRLRSGTTHLAALAACFPGGSITGAPKIRAIEIIDELEPVARGPYTGCAGYLGFNRESQLSILIRTAIVRGAEAWYHAGAGIVADSEPAAEYEETLAKARGFLEAAAALAPRATAVAS